LQKLAKDPRFIGGIIGMMGGLHTWKRDISYHPHVHYVVPGGGLSSDNTQWIPSSKDFLVPVEALSVIFRAKFRDELKKTDLYNSVPSSVWKKDWVVHSKPVDNGEKALMDWCCQNLISIKSIMGKQNLKVLENMSKNFFLPIIHSKDDKKLNKMFQKLLNIYQLTHH
jgi:hypothetical protein